MKKTGPQATRKVVQDFWSESILAVGKSDHLYLQRYQDHDMSYIYSWIADLWIFLLLCWSTFQGFYSGFSGAVFASAEGRAWTAVRE